MRIGLSIGSTMLWSIAAIALLLPDAVAQQDQAAAVPAQPAESTRLTDDQERLEQWGGYAEAKEQRRILYVAADGSGDVNCDGSDDQVEIGAALQQVAASEQLTTVHLKGPATYTVSDTIRIPGDTILQGDADAVLTVIPHEDAQWPPFKAMIECDGYGARNIIVRGFEIKGNRDSFQSDRHYYSIYLANAYDVTVNDMYIHDASGDGVKFQHIASRFSGTTPHQADGRWVRISDEELAPYNEMRAARGRSANLKIYNNDIERVGHDGVYILSVDDVEVRNNYIYSCRTNSNIRLTACNSYSIHDNVLRGNPDRGHSGNAGVQIQSGGAKVDDAEIYRNRISRKGLGGIIVYGQGAFDAQTGIHIHHNEITDCMIAGIRIFGVHETLIEHNTLYGNHGDGIVYYWVYNPDPARRPEDPPDGRKYATFVRNNIIANTLPGPGPESGWGRAGRITPVSGFGINNCVTESLPGDDRPGVVLTDTHEFVSEHNCLFGNVNGPYNQVSSDTDILEDPCFVDAQGGDFRLRPDSPCIGAGTDGGSIGAY